MNVSTRTFLKSFTYFKPTCILIILGRGCFVLAPPSIAIPSIGLVFLTVMCRLPWWSGTTRAARLSSSCVSPCARRCIDWCRRMPARSSAPAPTPPSSFMSKLRDNLWANSCNSYNTHQNTITTTHNTFNSVKL